MISFDSLIIGNTYNRPYLAKLWGYKDFHGIARGIVTPRNTNKIIIFITKQKQDSLTEYTDHFDRDRCLLFMEGEDKHKRDERLINSINSNDEIFLFYREVHHTPFEYMGKIHLSYYIKNSIKPSQFVFSTNRFYSNAYNGLTCEENTSGNSFDTFDSEDEGKPKIVKHISYERNLKNRAKAIEIHGTICSVCSFNFNEFYGKELASDYIEIHHIKPVSEFEGYVDPKTDLIPVCPNCHRMLHRYRNKTLSINELKKIIQINRKKL
ncbi:hypothetical protein CJF15_02020 [Clostridium botulinum]|uniref:HNH endonuclease n=1 Tax=Clostridium botulinum TaxID=1491 RepID=UPI00196A15C3|nr:HNH endonuclease [Clostridium botulinum]MBN3407950.1 hypothetical protein [Clostridium botulinum]MBY6872511.1 HNH endonuclease [Clostridium botulinum]